MGSNSETGLFKTFEVLQEYQIIKIHIHSVVGGCFSIFIIDYLDKTASCL